MLKIDEPTLTMNFCVNTSPLAGREGKFVTSRQIWDRLQKELRSNVALRVKETDEDGIFEVSGRGELHLTILLEEMRREGYELAVSKPRVVYRDVDGVRHEPIELVTADIEEGHQGGVMQALGERKGELVNMEPDGRGRVRLEYRIPARGLIGFTNEFLNLTRGSGLISNIFDSYEPHKGEIGGRKNGVLISMDEGEIFTYALGKLDDRGRMFVKANDPVYEGMIIGIHSRDNDLVVNATRTKQLTNFRVSGKEDAIKITPRSTCRWNTRWNSSRTTSWWKSPQEHPRAQAPPVRERAQACFARRRISAVAPRARKPAGLAALIVKGRIRGLCLLRRLLPGRPPGRPSGIQPQQQLAQALAGRCALLRIERQG